MSGNVDEWCQDWFDDYSSNAQIDPKGPKTGPAHVERGGEYDMPRHMSRPSYRPRYISKGCDKDWSHGLRLVLSEK